MMVTATARDYSRSLILLVLLDIKTLFKNALELF